MNHESKNLPVPEELCCPACGEMLTPADLEVYPCCPYCNHGFDRSSRLEDFVLAPVIAGWVGHCHARFPKK